MADPAPRFGRTLEADGERGHAREQHGNADGRCDIDVPICPFDEHCVGGELIF
jgi:hypothetical protein